MSRDIIILLNGGVSVERYYCPLEWWVYRSSDIIVHLNGCISDERYYCPLEWWNIGLVILLSS